LYVLEKLPFQKEICGIIIIIIIVCGTGVWTQGLRLEPLHQPFLMMGFLEIGSSELGSPKLFAQAGFEPQSSWSLPPE
jgi:hypothetical protein